MQTLTESVFKLAPPGGVFNTTVVRNLFPDISAGAQRALVDRALRAGEIQRLKAGLYILAVPYRKSELHPFSLASLLHFPSHVSLETALAFHGLIPEAVYQVACVTLSRSCRFDTPLGKFTFSRVPVNFGPAGVSSVRLDEQSWAFIACPLRAIADKIYLTRTICWREDGLDYLLDSLRIEEDDLRRISFRRYGEIHAAFRNKRVRHYLAGMKRELGK